jgi:hypothetical protein
MSDSKKSEVKNQVPNKYSQEVERETSQIIQNMNQDKLRQRDREIDDLRDENSRLKEKVAIL